jgi:hypothetical protein
MMSFLTYITGFFMNFELLPIMQIRKKGDEIIEQMVSDKIFMGISHRVLC